MNKLKKKIVFVGLSGGVDSAVSAALLKEQGYEVVGVFIKTWHPDFLVCSEEEERLDAMRVAAHLDIPFMTFDFEDVYKKEVADYMIKEYKAGRTPNPDVMCNKEVKFGAFLKKALSMGADFVATGHYAQNIARKVPDVGHQGSPDVQRLEQDHSKKQSLLLKGIDPSKDQSYFLWTLNQEQLKRILFPIGNLEKSSVRKLAKKFHLPVALKKDSQGICFLGAIDLKEFLKHYIKTKKGDVVVLCEVKGKSKCEVIGHHQGVVFYTLGERHGFTITKKNSTDGAYYVTAKDVKKNILTVSQNKKSRTKDVPDVQRLGNFDVGRLELDAEESTSLCLDKVNWISEIPKSDKTYTAQIRYHGEFLDCNIEILPKNKAKIIFKNPIKVASGQSCVIYDKDICLGGGVVV